LNLLAFLGTTFMNDGRVDDRLEQFGLWSFFHKHLIVELFTTLRDQLADAYWVDMESEILLVPQPSGPARPVAPDIDITQLKQSNSDRASSLDVTPALLEADEAIGEFEQNWIEIRRRDWPDPDDKLGSRIVSVIEVVSPTNKGIFGERDLRKFLAQRREYLLSAASYTEIDLLIGGTRDLPPPVERLEEHPLIVWSSQVQDQSRHYWAWGWQQTEPLPSFVLPLDHPNLFPVKLSECYQRAYDSNRWPSRLELMSRESC
jgi:hypothetical protein